MLLVHFIRDTPGLTGTHWGCDTSNCGACVVLFNGDSHVFNSDNPLGARAMYLGSTLYRIHGSNEPETIGQAVSSGCFRLTSPDVTDLYDRIPVGTKLPVTVVADRTVANMADFVCGANEEGCDALAGTGF